MVKMLISLTVFLMISVASIVAQTLMQTDPQSVIGGKGWKLVKVERYDSKELSLVEAVQLDSIIKWDADITRFWLKSKAFRDSDHLYTLWAYEVKCGRRQMRITQQLGRSLTSESFEQIARNPSGEFIDIVPETQAETLYLGVCKKVWPRIWSNKMSRFKQGPVS